ncbi:hypothetical protein GE061_013137 [Apolygus lucorum]|uniref:Uncharacterized protein n=1 Tax=Apolygus lucorum TaxID=248454 RepID=A0A6A4JXG8_APOLU|nr:hypothetical protein GE061_013137 [Apolygus lucorum]
MSSQIAVSAARRRHQSADSARRERSGSVNRGFSRHTRKSHARRGSENLSRHRRSEQFGSIGDNSDRHKRRRHSPKLCSDRRQKRRRRGSCDSRFSDSSDEVISLHGSNNSLYRVRDGGRGSDSESRNEDDSSSTASSPYPYDSSPSSSSSGNARRRQKRHHKKSHSSKKSRDRRHSKSHLRSLPKQIQKTLKRTSRPTARALDLDKAYTKEWKTLIRSGIEDKEVYKQLYNDYDPTVHLNYLVPPVIDEELAPHLPALANRRDLGLAATQKSSARALIATGAALTILTNHIKREENRGHPLAMSPTQSSDLHGFLWDATALLTASFYGTSKTRRNLLTYSLKPEFRQRARTAPLNDKLFGGQIPDWVKAHKSANTAAQHVTMSDLVIRKNNYRRQNQGNASRPAFQKNKTHHRQTQGKPYNQQQPYQTPQRGRGTNHPTRSFRNPQPQNHSLKPQNPPQNQ